MTSYLYHTPLSDEQQHTFGVVEAWPFALADRVRFAELDPLNHVNNVAYLTWFESARVAYFKHIGLSTYRDGAHEPRIVIRRGEMDWLQEMRADEDYAVLTKAINYRNTSFTLMQQIWSGGTKRAEFLCVIVLLTADGSQRMPIPDTIRQLFDAEIEG
ncbi:acyl-CoA thioesterase [Marivita hallyeonensis]|uniref:Acyl-CoA thioester hydrolase n=1 Tax=Marivita hallyeonensis TaxID=996342 RepID=A0A1M5VUP3_9RHOB|nr:thioesterase family protein [Marivita hallyeonensis]SHH78694.1 acyl-CoA thioester hydrolase [Marivita hallyeonensis]